MDRIIYSILVIRLIYNNDHYTDCHHHHVMNIIQGHHARLFQDDHHAISLQVLRTDITIASIVIIATSTLFRLNTVDVLVYVQKCACMHVCDDSASKETR